MSATTAPSAPRTSTVGPVPGEPGHTENEIVIAADLDLVWDVTNDLTRWPDLFTEYASCEVLDHTGETFRFRLTMHPDEQGRVWSWVSERTLDRDTHRVTARRVEPGPFEFMNIEWTYTQVEGGTRMRWVQDFRMRPQAPVTTAQMTERIDANSPIQMAHIAEQVEADQRSRGTVSDTTSEEGPMTTTTSPTEQTGSTTIQHAPTPRIPLGPVVHRATTAANRRRGGDIRTLLSPASVGASTGFLGTLTLAPGEVVTEHWHPYSEEFLYCVTGSISVTLDGEVRRLVAESAVHIPIGVRHRLVNDSDATAFCVFACTPLAPRPELGHVDTEALPGAISGSS